EFRRVLFRSSEPLANPQPSPALSQVGQTWPTDGRIIGIVAGDGDVAAVGAVRQAVLDGGMVPLVIGPTGGMLGGTLPVQRTYVTARSVEFDALPVASAPPPGKDAYGARDAKAGGGANSPVEPRAVQLIAEAYRHAKPIGGWERPRRSSPRRASPRRPRACSSATTA